MTRPKVRITVVPRPGETLDQAKSRTWFEHEVAALGEGCCPMCGARLRPVPTPLGQGGSCPEGHGRFWAGGTPGAWEGPYSVHQWAEINPYTGEPRFDDQGHELADRPW